MGWFSRKPQLEPEYLYRLGKLPAPEALSIHTLTQQRLVVLDLETTGFDLRRDLVISIGAVVIDQGAIPLNQLFERTLYRNITKVTESVLIHGIAPSALAAGEDPIKALMSLMEFVGSSPFLAYHARFDQQMLERALRKTLGYRLNHPFFDVAEIAPLLNPKANLDKAGLDDWIKYFGLNVHQRHHASADALVTAEIALILFKQAQAQGIENLAQLEQRLASWRRKQQANTLAF